ncbi:MAG TPA: hypothetical protein VNN22_18105 [Verrucomicrobiae bacterium]|nr:hypothetical protein [Verrucomicrobiae bacterium]
MSEQLPAPEFDAQNYARPNQNWICGHACEGNACRQGPDAKGRCCATAECKPILEIKPGETKGRWRCTRPGGACESGPLPDGSCCRPIARCSPVPTLRVWRGRVTLAVVAVSCAVLLVLLGRPPWRNDFINPGVVSNPHSGALFAALAATNQLNQNCGACHVAGNTGPNGMVHAALHAEPGMFDLKKLAAAKLAATTAIDESCVKCHADRNFHQPSAPPVSCSFCHAEHQGLMMAATTDANCSFCHGDAAKMARSSVAAEVTRLNSKVESGNSQSLLTSAATRSVIHHFSDDHPQFRFITEKLRDPDTLKFNHALHLTGATIPKLPGGEKLDCAFCHQPDAAGAFMRPVAFEKNCRVCHSLQFDPETPQLTLPHGSAEFVTAFLRSLPKQYLNLAHNPASANNFVEQKLMGLRTQFGSGEDLERRVFFSTATFGSETQIGTLSGSTRALFPGCAYCHEVKAAGSGSPKITPPMMMERWLAQAKFNHAKHANISCAQCHDAARSKDTADILLPAKETCLTCHSPHGGVVDTCATCHTFHHGGLVAR